jgi:hypothetical protein
VEEFYEGVLELTEIKFIINGTEDGVAILPVMRAVHESTAYTDVNIDEPEFWYRAEEYKSFGLDIKRYEELDVNNILIGSWGPLMREAYEKGFRKFIFLPHGVADDCPCLLEYKLKDRFELVVGQWQYSLREKFKQDQRLFITGFPKLDGLGKHPTVDHDLRKEILGNDNLTILWAPPGHEKYVFDIIPEMRKIKQSQDVNIILKLHAGGQHHTLLRVNSKFESDFCRVVWDHEYSIDPLMRISDLILSGCSSAPFGYTLTDRPIFTCALNPHDAMPWIPELLYSFNAVEREQLTSSLISALNSPENFVDLQKRQKLRSFIFSNIGTATEAVVKKIEEIRQII